MRNDRRIPSRRFSNAWVYVASAALTLFTVFVLLDTFAIARVQQTAEAADFSSIVAAQSSAGVDSASDTETGAQTSADNVAQTSTSSSASSSVETNASSGGSHGRNGTGSGPRSHGGANSSRSSSSAASSSAASSSSSSAASSSSSTEAASTASSSQETQIGSYSDENMQITVTKTRVSNTDVYVADITVSSAEYLKTALAQNSFGRNLKDTTSNMAEQANAVLAVNGDYYGFRDYGYVLRNGVLYRENAASGTDALVVYADGTMAAASQDEVTAQQLKDAGAWQVLSFGPVLVQDGKVAVSANEEVDQSMSSNPRTAIGMVSPLHYVVVVSDGRTNDNEGLSLHELAQVLLDNGATFAYNLDGGGSTTLYFQGEVLNTPTSGNRSGERQVSDIVYFG